MTEQTGTEIGIGKGGQPYHKREHRDWEPIRGTGLPVQAEVHLAIGALPYFPELDVRFLPGERLIWARRAHCGRREPITAARARSRLSVGSTPG